MNKKKKPPRKLALHEAAKIKYHIVYDITNQEVSQDMSVKIHGNQF